MCYVCKWLYPGANFFMLKVCFFALSFFPFLVVRSKLTVECLAFNFMNEVGSLSLRQYEWQRISWTSELNYNQYQYTIHKYLEKSNLNFSLLTLFILNVYFFHVALLNNLWLYQCSGQITIFYKCKGMGVVIIYWKENKLSVTLDCCQPLRI